MLLLSGAVVDCSYIMKLKMATDVFVVWFGVGVGDLESVPSEERHLIFIGQFYHQLVFDWIHLVKSITLP